MELIDKTMTRMDTYILDLRTYALRKSLGQESETREKINALANKTIDVISQAKDKVKEVSNRVSAGDELDSFLNNVLAKTEDSVKMTKERIDEFVPTFTGYSETEEKITEAAHKFIENENVQTAIHVASDAGDKVKEFINSPSTQAQIKKAKKATLNAAEKGMDLLRKALEDKED